MNFEKERAVSDLFWIKVSGRHGIFMAFAPSGTRRDIIFQSLKGKGKEHLEAYSKLTASWILITRRTKVDLGLPGTKEGSFPLTNSSPGLSALHRGRRRKENERARK